jgi:hypothetical protein
MRMTCSRPRVVASSMLAVVMTVSACGGSAAVTPTPPPDAASASAVPMPTGVPLPQTLKAKAGGRSVRYPAGWVGTDNLGIL